MADERKIGKHKIVMDKRENVSITGVVDVISFDEETIVADTDMGVLVLKGLNLHVTKLNVDSGELDIDGQLESLHYEEENSFGKGKQSFFGKMFK